VVWHSGGWPGWGSLMTLIADFGIGVAVLTNRDAGEVPQTLTWHIADRMQAASRRLAPTLLRAAR
jgi:hypothetical protein